MRVLHILDAAGVACIYSKYQRKQGHDAKVIWNRDVSDKYGIYDFYKDYLINVTYEKFTETCLQEAESADVIHVHGYIDILFELRKNSTDKKIILHYHGTDIRGLKRQELPHRSLLSDTMIKLKMLYRKKIGHIKAQKLADAVCVSTPDLLSLVRSDSIHIPIPIDTEHFSPNTDSKRELKDAFTINSEVTNIQRALDLCNENQISLKIDVIDRTKNPIMYSAIPDFIRGYKNYVDIRYVNDIILENLSSTALQSLACGLSVLDYELQFRRTLPREHDAVNVASQLSKIYTSLDI